MRSGLLLRLGALAGAAKLAAAECPNACSGRGTCGAYDMCSCYNGYMGNDCSERVCPFGLAHVDSPKGDLDMDNDVEFSTVISGSQMYKDGTSERFPIMKTSAALGDDSQSPLADTAHYYMECSNKGLCDRLTATCGCFVGYEGTSCQRASCPNDCSGHGVCRTNRELATGDYGNVYELWDADMSLACDCDAGYGGYDCSEQNCPYGIDPLFIDDENTARMPEWTIYFEDASDLVNGGGTWRLRFYDVWGEDWVTDPIPFNGNDIAYTDAFATDCNTLVSMLEAIPNDIIDDSTVSCLKTRGQYPAAPAGNSNYWVKYELKFIGNPGAHKIPEIIEVDEAERHTLVHNTNAGAEYAGLDKVKVYDTGITGEFHDYFGRKCGVTVTISNPADVYGPDGYASAKVAEEIHYGEVQRATVASGTIKALKECLGDSDGILSNNFDVANWDDGTMPLDNYGPPFYNDGTTPRPTAIKQAVPDHFPHIVKLVKDIPGSDFDGGVYTIMSWHETDQNFVLSAGVDDSFEYQVYATDGVLERVWYDTNMDGEFKMYGTDHADDNYDDMGMARWNQYEDVIYTDHDYSCENAGRSGDGSTGTGDPVFYDGSSYLQNNCLEKGDFLVIPSFTTGTLNKDTLGSDIPQYGDTQADAQATLNSAGLYEIMKISVEDWTATTNSTEDRFQIKLDRPIFWDGSDVMINEAWETGEEPGSGIRNMFRFIPDMGSPNTAEWVAPCSNRGLCDLTSGLCSCFAGYTNENCDTQSALAV